jgi:hypothetical protein
MPSKSYWIGQFLLAASTMFAILIVVELLKGHTFGETWPSTLAWTLAVSAIFIGNRYRNVRKGIACALCKDLPAKK